MKQLSLLFIATILTLSSFAFETGTDTVKYWKSKYESAIGFSQTSLTNWTKGGENSVSVKAMINIFEDYSKGKFTWNNYLGAAYMIQKQQSTNWRKADDKLNLFTKAGIYAWKHWDYTGLLEFKSQFSNGYNYPNDSVYTSKFMAPGYFQLSIGLSYKPVDYFSVLLSPIGARLTVVNDQTLSDQEAYGVKKGEKSLLQAGASVNAIIKKDLFKNVSLLSKLDLFNNYLKNPQNIIVSWENNLLLKFTKYISVNLATMLIYDDNILYKDPKDTSTDKGSPKTQFMETLSVGFTYTLSR
ncbi:MAG: DUF3078 domain-containing protein [Bacteroidetes bacterium]|nr:DUF3078 domain-containing protein [Bacteroidota bacterium]